MNDKKTYLIEYWFKAQISKGGMTMDSSHFKCEVIMGDPNSWWGPVIEDCSISFIIGEDNKRVILTPDALNEFSKEGRLGYDFIVTELKPEQTGKHPHE